MDAGTLMVVGVLGGLAGFGVAYALSLRKKSDVPLQDIDALAVEVERISKLVRRISMRNLRQDALDSQLPAAPLQPAQPATAADLKAELRRKVFGVKQP
jgi:hypothetical protein